MRERMAVTPINKRVPTFIRSLRTVSLLEAFDTDRKIGAVDLVHFNVHLNGRGFIHKVICQRLHLDVRTPVIDHLGQFRIRCRIPGGDMVFDIELCVLAHCLDATNDLTRRPLGTKLGRKFRIDCDSQHLVGGHRQTCGWLRLHNDLFRQ